mgnify:FL=1
MRFKYGYRAGEQLFKKQHGSGKVTLTRKVDQLIDRPMQISAAFSFPASFAIADARHIPTCVDGLASRIFGNVEVKEFFQDDIARAIEKYKETIPIIPNHLFLSYSEWRKNSSLP